MILSLTLAGAALAQMPAQPFHAKADPLFTVGQGQTRELRIVLSMDGETKLYTDMVALEVASPGDLAVGEPVIPAGEPFLDPYTDAQRPVYTKPVTLLLPVTAPDKRGRQDLEVQVLWQGCSPTMCYPPSGETLVVPVRVTRPRD